MENILLMEKTRHSPVDMVVYLPIFTRFSASQVVQEVFHQQDVPPEIWPPKYEEKKTQQTEM